MLTTGPSQPPFESLAVLAYIIRELSYTKEALTCGPTSIGELGVKSWQVPPYDARCSCAYEDYLRSSIFCVCNTTPFRSYL